RKDIKTGEASSRRLNERATRMLSKDGILDSASCSMPLAEDNLHNIVLQSARHLDRNIMLLERGHQGPDHPEHMAIPETRYIKSLTCRLLLRITRTLALTLAAGVPMLTALVASASTCGNQLYQRHIALVHAQVAQGIQLHAAMR